MCHVLRIACDVRASRGGDAPQAASAEPLLVAAVALCGAERAARYAASQSTRNPCGGMPEWLNGAVSKTVVRVTVPGVRIPLPPPIPHASRIGVKQF